MTAPFCVPPHRSDVALFPGGRPASLDTAEHLPLPRDYRNNYPFGEPQEASDEEGERPFDWSAGGPEEEAERAAAHDRAKVTLHAAISRAAGWALTDGRGRGPEHRGGGACPCWPCTLTRMASAVLACRTAKAYRDGNCGRYLVRPQHCGNPLEPDCARRRTARLLERFDLVALDTVRDVFWVLTLPNAPLGGLDAGLAVLYDALTHLRPWLRERGALGGVTSIEMPYQARAASWNLHANLLIDQPAWITHAAMREHWRAVTCDAIRRAERRAAGIRGRLPRCPHHYDAQFRSVGSCRGASWVWVRRVQGAPGSPERRKSWRELVKYVTKGFLSRGGELLPNVPDQAFAEVLMATRHRRLVQGWGTWFGIHDRVEESGVEEEILVGPDVLPDHRGLPRFCPFCGTEAAWDLSIEVPRVACRWRGRHLTWEPPPTADRVH